MQLRGVEMNYPHFVRIDQESSEGASHHFVVHTHDPKLAVEFSAEAVDGKIKPGTIQRIAVPNSWAGQYSQYAKLVTKAESFFRASLGADGEASVPERGSL